MQGGAEKASEDCSKEAEDWTDCLGRPSPTAILSRGHPSAPCGPRTRYRY